MKMKMSALPQLLLLSAFCGSIQAQSFLSFLVNGEDTVPQRYPYFVSLRDTNQSSSSSYYSPPPPVAGALAPSSAPKLVHQCGGVLISDWLVLTAGQCAPQNRVAYSSDFRTLGLPFTGFQNAFVPSSSYADNVTAFVGAEGIDLGSAQGNTVQMWFVHPWYDETSLQYDIAVGLLSSPERTATKAKLISGASDIYDALMPGTNLTAVGMGRQLSASSSQALASISPTFKDPSTNPQRKLQEVVLGSLSPRVACGRALTNRSTEPYSSSTSNIEYSYYGKAEIISEGQFCIQGSPPTGSAPATPGYFDTSFLNLYNDTCRDDQGTPTIVKGASAAEDMVVGMYSWGFGCGQSLPKVYTSLAGFQNLTLFDNFLTNITSLVPNTYSGRGSSGSIASRSSLTPPLPVLGSSGPAPSLNP